MRAKEQRVKRRTNKLQRSKIGKESNKTSKEQIQQKRVMSKAKPPLKRQKINKTKTRKSTKQQKRTGK